MITTHVLDTARGRPAAGVAVLLEVQAEGGAWRMLGRGETDSDGRLRTLLAPDAEPRARPGARPARCGWFTAAASTSSRSRRDSNVCRPRSTGSAGRPRRRG